MREGVLPVTVVYCDEHMGYTASTWILEFTDIMEQEYHVKPLVRLKRDCSIEADPTILVAGSRIEGLPSDPGHLYEMLKHTLDKLAGRGGASLTPD